MYKLLICDDEELSREGLSEYVKSIRNDIEIIGYGIEHHFIRSFPSHSF